MDKKKPPKEEIELRNIVEAVKNLREEMPMHSAVIMDSNRLMVMVVMMMMMIMMMMIVVL